MAEGGNADAAVCVVGAGRLGRALVVRLSEDGPEPVVLSRRPGRVRTAHGRTVEVVDTPARARGCHVVLLAVPATEVAAALQWIAPFLVPGVVAVNVATDLPTSEIATPEGVRVVGCKVIGQSGQIERGRPAALVVDGASPTERALLARLLRPVGVVIDAPEHLVMRVNELVARRVIDAQQSLARELEALALPPVAREAALGNLALGVWDAVASGNTGPFLSRLVAEAGERD
jgi:pyrroline-5-carboxylate reductase